MCPTAPGTSLRSFGCCSKCMGSKQQLHTHEMHAHLECTSQRSSKDRALNKVAGVTRVLTEAFTVSDYATRTSVLEKCKRGWLS